MCRFISRTRFIIKLRMARPSSPSASALRLARGWIAILTGGTTTSLSGIATIRARPIGGMSRRASGTRGHTTVWHPDNHPGAVGANRGDRGWGTPNNQPVVEPAPVAATVGRSVSVGQPRDGHRPRRPGRKRRQTDLRRLSPDPRRLRLNMPSPSAGRNRTAHSSASRVRRTPEPTATAASRACRR